MTEGIESITTRALSMALDAASLRQQVIATNIANVNATGYVAHHLSFEGQVGDALRDIEARGTTNNASLDAVQFRLQPALNALGQPAPVQLDMEMADSARNSVQYQALVKGLSRHFSILSSAVSDGKK